MKKVIIVGGGLSGLITAFQLVRAGISTTLVEKKTYPFHRVCGEYISGETIPFLKSLGLYPDQFSPPHISRFQLTSFSGRAAIIPLAVGGFGISRFHFDQFLFEKALEAGVKIHMGTEVNNVHFDGVVFHVDADDFHQEADVVIGAFGKRSRMDVQLARPFVRKRSPYAAVKYHIRTEHPADLVALHNFKNGYCGISNVEGGVTNLCYLTHRDNLKEHGSIPAMEEAVLFRNPVLKSIFSNSDFLFARPDAINEISFETKGPVEQHILLSGDAAGMITPLCGNGMALAIHSAKILSPLVTKFCKVSSYGRIRLESDYSHQWKNLFQRRLWVGRQIQQLFGGEWSSNLAVNIMLHTKPVARFLVSKTHGKPF